MDTAFRRRGTSSIVGVWRTGIILKAAFSQGCILLVPSSASMSFCKNHLKRYKANYSSFILAAEAMR